MTFENIDNFNMAIFRDNHFDFATEDILCALPSETLSIMQEVTENLLFTKKCDFSDFYNAVGSKVAEILIDKKMHTKVIDTIFESGKFGYMMNNVFDEFGFDKNPLSYYIHCALSLVLEDLILYCSVADFIFLEIAKKKANEKNMVIDNETKNKLIKLFRVGTQSDEDVEEFSYKFNDILSNLTAPNETFKSLFEKLYKDTGISCDENIDLARILPNNAMDIAIKVVKDYGYNTNSDDFAWDKVLDMCNDIACEICKIDLENASKFFNISDVVMKYFFTDYVESYGYNKNHTMQMIVGECYHKAIANLCSEPCVLDYFKRV